MQARTTRQVFPLHEWSLTSLIEVSSELGLVGKTAKQAAWALKDFRNFIHPYNLLQQSARPDPTLTECALAEITRSVKGRLPTT
jgi:hypothetical protein